MLAWRGVGITTCTYVGLVRRRTCEYEPCVTGRMSRMLPWRQIPMTWVQMQLWCGIVIISTITWVSTVTSRSTWRWTKPTWDLRRLRLVTTEALPPTPQVSARTSLHTHIHTQAGRRRRYPICSMWLRPWWIALQLIYPNLGGIWGN